MLKLTKNSEILMSFFLQQKCINHSTQNSKTNNILSKFYNDIKHADGFITNKINTNGIDFYNLKIKQIKTINQIPKPKSFSSYSFPKEIMEYIINNMLYELLYSFSLFDRDIKIYFVINDNPEYQIELYNEYIKKILNWLFVINKYSSKTCSKQLVLYIYFTPLEKKLPSSNNIVLNEINVNTAFTTTCPINSEIVIFRKEEWFKVLIHESFHNFALDFSDMNITESTNRILSIFKVNSDVNLYEAYTEFWAEIMNAVFCSYYLSENSNITEFLSNCEFFINFERSFKIFQMIKILDFMGLTYNDLYSSTNNSIKKRETLYKENTNVLSYYIITTILMNNYQDFLLWCDTNNSNTIQFNKTNENINKFCDFIEENYKIKSIIHSSNCIQKTYLSVKSKKINKQNKQNKNLDYILNNMRMSICELG